MGQDREGDRRALSLPEQQGYIFREGGDISLVLSVTTEMFGPTWYVYPEAWWTPRPPGHPGPRAYKQKCKCKCKQVKTILFQLDLQGVEGVVD